MRKFEHLDVVFIDTAGRNYKETKYVKDLKKLIDFEEKYRNISCLINNIQRKRYGSNY